MADGIEIHTPKDREMTKQQFKETYTKHLRSYLPDQYKDVKILIRIAKKGDNLFTDDERSSIRQVNHEGSKWRVEFRGEMMGIDLQQIMLLAHYKTAEVSWDYEGKGQ